MARVWALSVSRGPDVSQRADWARDPDALVVTDVLAFEGDGPVDPDALPLSVCRHGHFGLTGPPPPDPPQRRRRLMAEDGSRPARQNGGLRTCDGVPPHVTDRIYASVDPDEVASLNHPPDRPRAQAESQ
jgi:hypothetical protein